MTVEKSFSCVSLSIPRRRKRHSFRSTGPGTDLLDVIKGDIRPEPSATNTRLCMSRILESKRRTATCDMPFGNGDFDISHSGTPSLTYNWSTGLDSCREKRRKRLQWKAKTTFCVRPIAQLVFNKGSPVVNHI